MKTHARMRQAGWGKYLLMGTLWLAASGATSGLCMQAPPKAKAEGSKKTEAPLEISPRIRALSILPAKNESVFTETVGAGNIRIELEKEPEKARAYAAAYNDLVSSIAAIMGSAYGKMGEEKFMSEVWGIIRSNLDMEGGEDINGPLYRSLKTSSFDCDTSSLLVMDIAHRLGLKAEIAMVTGHVMAKTENFVFQTTSGEYFPASELRAKYHCVYIVTSEPKTLRALAYHSRADEKVEAKDYKGAIADYSRATALIPGDSVAYSNIGLAFYRMGKYDDALVSLKQATDIDPKNPVAYNVRGLAYAALKRDIDAIRCFGRAVEYDPDNLEAFRNLGDANLRQGRYQKAIESFHHVVVRDGKDADALKGLAISASKAGDPENAILYIGRMIDLDAANPEGYELRAGFYDSINQPEQARAERGKAESLRAKKVSAQ
jgi:Flp pilus assembly protein TadD